LTLTLGRIIHSEIKTFYERPKTPEGRWVVATVRHHLAFLQLSHSVYVIYTFRKLLIPSEKMNHRLDMLASATRKRTARRTEPELPVIPITDRFVKEEYSPLLEQQAQQSTSLRDLLGGTSAPTVKKSYDEGVLDGFSLGFDRGFKKAILELANTPIDPPFVEWENRVLVVEGEAGSMIPEGEVRRFPMVGRILGGKVAVFDGDEQLAKTFGGPKQVAGRGLLKPDLQPLIERDLDIMRQSGIIAPQKNK